MSVTLLQAWEAFARQPSNTTFAPFYRLTRNRVYAICLSILRHPEDADDAFQAVYARLLALIGPPVSGDLPPSLDAADLPALPDLDRLSVREADALSKRRRRRAGKEIAMEPLPNSEAAGPSARIIAAEAETRRIVGALLDELPDKYRAPLLLRYFDGMSQSRIAEALQTPASTIAWRINKALKILGPKMRRAGLADTLAALTLVAVAIRPAQAPARMTASFVLDQATLLAPELPPAAAAGGAWALVSTKALAGLGVLTAAAAVASLVWLSDPTAWPMDRHFREPAPAAAVTENHPPPNPADPSPASPSPADDTPAPDAESAVANAPTPTGLPPGYHITLPPGGDLSLANQWDSHGRLAGNRVNFIVPYYTVRMRIGQRLPGYTMFFEILDPTDLIDPRYKRNHISSDYDPEIYQYVLHVLRGTGETLYTMPLPRGTAIGNTNYFIGENPNWILSSVEGHNSMDRTILGHEKNVILELWGTTDHGFPRLTPDGATLLHSSYMQARIGQANADAQRYFYRDGEMLFPIYKPNPLLESTPQADKSWQAERFRTFRAQYPEWDVTWGHLANIKSPILPLRPASTDFRFWFHHVVPRVGPSPHADDTTSARIMVMDLNATRPGCELYDYAELVDLPPTIVSQLPWIASSQSPERQASDYRFPGWSARMTVIGRELHIWRGEEDKEELTAEDIGAYPGYIGAVPLQHISQ